jgi:hypothetical protein
MPLKQLESTTNITSTNLLFIKISDSADLTLAIQQIRMVIQAVIPDLNVFDYSHTVKENYDFCPHTGTP